MRRRLPVLVALLLPAALAAQSSATPQSPTAASIQFVRFGDIFGGRLLMAFDSIPAAQYGYRPTGPEQTVENIAQHRDRR